jgi:hypothetical protein
MCTGTMTLRPVSVWHVLPRAQLQSSRRAFATARRRRPGGSHLPGRATRTMRGRVSFAAAAASTAALGARRDGPARGTASPARHPKDAWPRARLGYRRRRTTGKVAAAASDDVLDEGKSVTLSVVPRVAARRAPLDDPLAPLHPRTARSFSSHIFFFFPRSRTSRPTVTTTRQRKGRSERAPARDAAAPMTRRRCPSRARPVTTRRRLVPTRRRREGFQSESGISSPRRSENDFFFSTLVDARRVCDCFYVAIQHTDAFSTHTHDARVHYTHNYAHGTPHEKKHTLLRRRRRLG